MSVTWEDGEHADLHLIVLISRNADGSWNMDSLVTDLTPSGSPHPVPMRDRPAGTYLIGVAAGQDDGDWSDWGNRLVRVHTVARPRHLIADKPCCRSV